MKTHGKAFLFNISRTKIRLEHDLLRFDLRQPCNRDYPFSTYVCVSGGKK